MKRIRHKAILDLVRTAEIASQEDLMRGLQAKDIEVSQSTLSRDIQELRLAKTAGVYTVVEADTVKHPQESLRRILREFLIDIDATQNLVILKTGPGNASVVSQALDDAQWPETVGSIAGENTIFVAVRSPRDGKKIERRIRSML